MLSNNASPDPVKESPGDTGPSSFSGAEKRHSSPYGFAKSARSNINDDEEHRFKEAAKVVLSLAEDVLAARVKRGDLVEVKSE